MHCPRVGWMIGLWVSALAAGCAGLPVGSQAPDFTLNDLSGKPVSLGAYRGTPVILAYFATW